MRYLEGLCRVNIGVMERKWKLLHYSAIYERVMEGLYWDNGEENGNYYIIMRYIKRLCRGYIGGNYHNGAI